MFAPRDAHKAPRYWYIMTIILQYGLAAFREMVEPIMFWRKKSKLSRRDAVPHIYSLFDNLGVSRKTYRWGYIIDTVYQCQDK